MFAPFLLGWRNRRPTFKDKGKPTMEPFCLIIDGGRVPTEEHFEVLNPAK